MNNKKTRLQRFISSSIAVLLFAAIALGAALPAAASTAASFTAEFAETFGVVMYVPQFST